MTTRTWALRPAEEADRALLGRVARRTALQSAAFVAVVFLLCAALVLLVERTSQNRAVANQLAASTAHLDDLANPPAGTWLYLQRPGASPISTPGSPPVLPERADLAAVARLGATGVLVHDVDTPRGEFRIRTQNLPTASGGGVVQAALSLQPQHQERSRLLLALGAAGGLALIGAVSLGALAGRRSVLGLLDTLRRQRRFVADASHELRTPLTVLTTRSQLLRRRLAETGLPDADRERLLGEADRLLADSVRLNEVVEDLLLAAEPVRDRNAVVDLTEIVVDVAASTRALAEDRGVVLGRVGLEQPVLVRAGSPALRRSLLAMLDNAIRHTPAGGSVTVSVERVGTNCSVRIRDTGAGVAPELGKRVFERTSTTGGGSAADGRRRYGLGLALVAETAHRFGGGVDVDSSPEGSCFTLTLPAARTA